jgi:serine O-acetyltransferase
MSTLKELLYKDLARQFELEGRGDVRPNFFRFLRRLFHFKYLPNVIFRSSRAALLAGIPFVPWFLMYLNVVLFGVEITPRTEIGPGFYMPHPVGCVIGAWRIGSNVTMFQGVGLGAVNDMCFLRELRCEIGNNVILGTGCKIMGPYMIGDNVKVGANSVVTCSIADNMTVVGLPARPVLPRTLEKPETADTAMQ